MEAIQILGSLGEFVGAIAVVATLIYLTIQVRNSREAMEENSLFLSQNIQRRQSDSSPTAGILGFALK